MKLSDLDAPVTTTTGINVIGRLYYLIHSFASNKFRVRPSKFRFCFSPPPHPKFMLAVVRAALSRPMRARPSPSFRGALARCYATQSENSVTLLS